MPERRPLSTSPWDLEAEILTLRHQPNVLRRKSPKRLAFSNFDRLVFAGLYRLAPGVVTALETGLFCLASCAFFSKVAASMPATDHLAARSIREIAKPPGTGPK
jgi:hypothetical protein